MQQPRVLVIGGNPGRWNARERAQLAPYATGIEAWVHATQGVYIDHTSVSLRDVHQFDIVICNTNRISSSSAVEKYARLAENRRDSVLWVSLLEGDMRHYMRPSPFVRRALDASTLVNCINHNATESIQQTTSARVAYIGIPYPVSSVAALATSVSNRKRRVFLCGFLPQRWNDVAAAQQLGIPMDGYHVRMHRKIGNAWSNLQQFGTIHDSSAPLRQVEASFRAENLHVRPETTTKEYLTAMGANVLWMNLDERYTWGRYVLDAAALGVPIVTTRSTGHGQLLFPRTTVETAFSQRDAVALANALLHDADLYANVAEHAREHIWQYDAPVIVRSLYDHLGL